MTDVSPTILSLLKHALEEAPLSYFEEQRLERAIARLERYNMRS